ncbi:MAG: hypothetical protein RIM23_09830 [Coleofasciculus sp. G3-WIS-01]|uniref:hypothetical protein n=1 Tax=Coleofasciculus sp. G3-WIS-01 TaxID=3069528 RepID=UPI0032FC620E
MVNSRCSGFIVFGSCLSKFYSLTGAETERSYKSIVGAGLGTIVGAGLGTIVGAGLGTIVGAGLGTIVGAGLGNQLS